MVAVMVDMDLTLIEAVSDDDHRYDNWGQIVTFMDHGEEVKYRVHVRPHAIQMVNDIVRTGCEYIVWSAGTYHYVHAVMKFFSEQAKVWPQKIYTREDMVLWKEKKYKSMTTMGYKNFLIIDDNPELIMPSERDHIIRIQAWSLENHVDRDLDWVSSLLKIYAKDIPVIAKGKTFRMTDLS